MRKLHCLLIGVGMAAVVSAGAQKGVLQEPKREPIVGMNTPALSPDGSTICFSYRGDLWTVPATGGEATRITIHDAHDAYPVWSPDGKWIAFASDRYPASTMNYDVFVMPSSGGEPRRLTYHTNNDYPFDWSSDGRRLLLQAIRASDGWRAIELEIDTGRTKTLTRGRALIRYARYSADGAQIAYTRSARIGAWWRPRYHGSANMDVWVQDVKTGKATQLTDYDGADLWPMFAGDGPGIYYVSDALTPGAPNLVMASLRDRKPVSVTRHSSGAVQWPSMSRDRSAIVYVHEGRLQVYSTRERKSRPVEVFATSDLKQNRTERLTLASRATELEVAPDGKTVALAIRGDIWTVPADRGGEAKRLTDDPANDYDFVWSPDGAHIAFASDRTGAYRIYVLDTKSREARELNAGAGDAGSPQWSPDGKRVAYLLSGPEGGLYVTPADGTGPAVRIAASNGNNRFGVGISSYAWSPDGRWLAFARRDRLNTTDVWVVSAAGGVAVNVTNYPGSNDSPRWTSDGAYLAFTSSRDRPVGEDLYAVSLLKPKKTKDGEKPSPATTGGVRIDFEGIEQRASRLTASGVTAYELAPDGKSAFGITSFGSGPDLCRVSITGGPLQRITSTGDIAGVPRFAGGPPSRFWCLAGGGSARSYSQSGPTWAAGPLAYTAQLISDRDRERLQVFNEFWRSIGSGFYDPTMHGVDWEEVRRRYEPLMSGIGTSEELAFFLLSPMAGELNASHAEVSPSVTGSEPDVSELGLTFGEAHVGPGVLVTGYVKDGPNDDGRPLIQPGEYILKVDGKDVVWGEGLWSALAGRADKETDFVVSADPKGEGSRTVKLTPVTSERMRELQYEEEVRRGEAMVSRLSGGRVAYIRIRSMDVSSTRRFERELWGMAQSADALILDVRDNGGGSTHDVVLSQLARSAYGRTQPRDGVASTQPWRHWGRPMALLINENSASDAEILAMGFRELKLGHLIGNRTPGYAIGTYTARLQDGTSYRIPMWGWRSLDGRNLENSGVRPDIVVDNGEAEIGAPEDRQLKSAVEALMREVPRR